MTGDAARPTDLSDEEYLALERETDLRHSTESRDRTGKFRRYRKLAALRDDFLVSQHERRIEVYPRRDDGVWEPREAGDEESVPLSAFATSIEVDRVDRGVTLTPETAPERG